MNKAHGDQRAVAVIPARYGSSRLPGKPLKQVLGRTLIEHVWRRVRAASCLTRVVVATDDQRILEAVRAFGGEARLTGEHPSGSDRIGELLPQLDEDTILNVQGDEPEIDPQLLDALTLALQVDPDLDMVTAATPFPADQDPANPNRVKVVTDLRGRALYFSRAAIPARRDPPLPSESGESDALLHLGVYAYRRAALERFLSLPQGRLERGECLEQLRLLENGMCVGVIKTPVGHWGIDTPADLEAFRQRKQQDRSNRGRPGEAWPSTSS